MRASQHNNATPVTAESSKVAGTWRWYLDLIAAIAMTAAAIALIAFLIRVTFFPPRPVGRAELPVPAEPVSMAGGLTMGEPSAPIVLLMFSDFDCPFCTRFAMETLPTLRRDFVRTGLVQLAFWNFPLDIHPEARKAAEAAECAGDQGRFWEMHDGLLASPTAGSSVDALSRVATSAGLNIPSFKACLAAGKSPAVDGDLAIGKALQITVTPSFFIGRREPDGRVHLTRRITGAKPAEDFRAAIQKEAKGASRK